MSSESNDALLSNPALAGEVAEKISELLAETRSLQAVPDEFADHGALAWQESEDHRNEIYSVVERASETLSHYGLNQKAQKIKAILEARQDDFFWTIQDTRYEGEYLVVREIEDLLDHILYAIQPRRARAVGESDPGGTVGVLERICSRFHLLVGGFAPRHAGRPGIKIEDEYDVQDVLRGLLRLFFDDVRPEDFVPNYAGSRTRIDFVLKDEKTVIEAKMTRDGLGDKEIGRELGLDIMQYRAHPDARTLVCFVYDPEHRVANPRGLEKDLMALSDDRLRVVVFIRPK